jgi:hypothetical protein
MRPLKLWDARLMSSPRRLCQPTASKRGPGRRRANVVRTSTESYRTGPVSPSALSLLNPIDAVDHFVIPQVKCPLKPHS